MDKLSILSLYKVDSNTSTGVTAYNMERQLAR